MEYVIDGRAKRRSSQKNDCSAMKIIDFPTIEKRRENFSATEENRNNSSATEHKIERKEKREVGEH